jgi:hypothetical protein
VGYHKEVEKKIKFMQEKEKMTSVSHEVIKLICRFEKQFLKYQGYVIQLRKQHNYV